jgi:hypothetical protein
MTRHARHALVIALSLICAAGAAAQEPVGSSATPANSAPGWTVTPAFGYGATFDDNVSLFGVETVPEELNDDFISTYHPALSIDYYARHLRFGADYSGTLLSYRTFTALNRWDQRGKISISRQETARLKWLARASAAARPSTDLIDLAGIPYRNTGARTADARGDVDFAIGARDGLTSSIVYLDVEFDQAPAPEPSVILRGGHVLESLNDWRHKFSPRMSVGTDYSFRRATVIGDVEQFSIHATEVAVDYDLSPTWSFSGAAGVAHLESTATTTPRTGPAWRAGFARRGASSSVHVAYQRSFVPSFGFGGTIQNQEARFGYRTALFRSRHWYTDQSAVFRDDQPMTSIFQQLPLRSLRTNSVLGWEPQPWVRLEVFYARVQQTSLRFGGQLYRNRVGFQVVTSKPVRVS